MSVVIFTVSFMAIFGIMVIRWNHKDRYEKKPGSSRIRVLERSAVE